MDEAAKACVKANDIKFIMAQVYGNAVCTLSVDNASVYYADNYTVVVGGETFVDGIKQAAPETSDTAVAVAAVSVLSLAGAVFASRKKRR